MNCPHCPATTLVISERSGIEIDYCPQCRGVWLDRGELDKLIERSLADLSPAHAAYPVDKDDRGDRGDKSHRDDRYDRNRYPDQRSTGQRPRKSWLSEIFD